MTQLNFVGAAIIFTIGLGVVILHNNLIRKIIGINLMETAVFLVFVTIGFVADPTAPTNPLPAALILTGVVVAVSITVFALSIVVRLHGAYGTVELDRILALRAAEPAEGEGQGAGEHRRV